MKHRIAGKKLSRDKNHRKALFKNLLNALISYGEIQTTESKAKAVRRLFEKLITKGKKGTIHARRLILAFLNNREAVNKLVDEIAPLFKKHSGGFTRMIRLRQRRGDNAMIVKLELIKKPKKKENLNKKTTKEKNEKNQDNQSK